MSQNQAGLQAPPEGLCHAMAAARARDRNGKPLNASAMLLHRVLESLGGAGKYPGPGVLSALMDVHRCTINRHEKSLLEAALLEFAQDAGGEKCYRLKIPDLPTAAQQRGMQDCFGGPVAVVPMQPPAKPKRARRQAQQPPAVEVPAPAVEAQPQPQPDAQVSPAPVTATAVAEPATEPAKPATKAKLTDEAKAWFLASPDRMDLYLRFGVSALGKTREECEGVLPSGQTDWLHFFPAPRTAEQELNPCSPAWGVNHLMGYYWHGVCHWRAKGGLEITFPQWDRLAGEVKKLLATTDMRGAFYRAYTVVNHFDLIRWRLGRIATDLTLNEITLNHKLVAEQAMLIPRRETQEPGWLNEQYARMNNNETPEGE